MIEDFSTIDYYYLPYDNNKIVSLNVILLLRLTMNRPTYYHSTYLREWANTNFPTQMN